ncbi:cytochrome c [Marivita sp. GX14005]|uniref:c-type cytochrome n=1 Tax=Marivita sp. GX14005 TaxID=2942276 RepID=UPI002019E08E|nr:cytochrome c [Marivita sp. GX14005]MCL3883649.1 cytochrome c [Marivita sp. GX14005]
MKTVLTATIAAATLLTGAAVFAETEHEAQLKARQGQFRIMAINLGILGGMAKGEIEYNADLAQAAADTLVAVSTISQAPMWPEGSDNMSIDGTRAQPTIWEKNDDFLGKWADLHPAALELQQAAGSGREALGPMMAKVGGTCKACHDEHRAPEDQ